MSCLFHKCMGSVKENRQCSILGKSCHEFRNKEPICSPWRLQLFPELNTIVFVQQSHMSIYFDCTLDWGRERLPEVITMDICTCKVNERLRAWIQSFSRSHCAWQNSTPLHHQPNRAQGAYFNVPLPFTQQQHWMHESLPFILMNCMLVFSPHRLVFSHTRGSVLDLFLTAVSNSGVPWQHWVHLMQGFFSAKQGSFWHTHTHNFAPSPK